MDNEKYSYSEKKFKGQHSGEKVLLKKHEHIINVFQRFIKNILLVLIFSIIVSYITYLITNNIILPVIIILMPVFIALFFIIKFYKETYIIFTNKRVIKSVRNGLFSSHLKELTVDNIKQVTTTNFGILGKVFNYGNINIRGYDESDTIFFKAVKENKDISIYISRVISYIKEKGNNEEISSYISKKNRK